MKTGRSHGFTLIELVMVIVIVSVLAVGVTRFITATVGGYVDTAERQQMATAGLIAAEKMSRAIRSALPNSVRVASGCIEFIPVLAGTDYVSAPISSPAASIDAVGARLDNAVIGRAAIYPIDQTELYDPQSPGPNSLSEALAQLPTGSDDITVTLSANHQFPTDSPARRLYLVGTPVAFCQSGAAIYRYVNYGFNATPDLPPSSGAVREMLINLVAAGTTDFNYTPASLVRNAVVQMSFRVSDGGESFDIQQEVNIRNVP
ncbi:prepilin-type N-terminal cleavage/methylation domain-containing protein [Hahella aquimaris]|uniref:PulJ/GspJ family protein n=1 Tax=Hahella sp. HNIBRBA332 TaxID=3015983 RepID=UPI00273AE015|nr:prepilin-type N-terminal cleavage/methylation domain-containing protein [Hahella sp. HNIBRBA332]WLQ13863.1 prepilin-type N-terminal cleavage/methylation domain-containing protein [Hahella sp. HNIBRBA332]